MKTSRILIFCHLLVSAIWVAPVSAQQIFFSDNNGVLYYTNVDNDCEVVTIGSLLYDTGLNLISILATDLAFHPNGNLYVTNGISLYQVDVTTGMCTLIGNHSPSFSVYLNALVAGGDGTLYGAGGSLYTVDINTGFATLLGGLPVPSAGDLAFNDGQLYMAGSFNQLVSVNIDSPASSTVVGTMTVGYEFFGIVTSASECTDAVTYGTSDNSLYSLDVTNAEATFVCDLVNTIIYGAAMPTEFTAEDCDFVLDLDGDDSSGVDGSDFLAEPACDGGPFFIADNDLFIDTEEEIDSMHIYLAGGNIDAPFEVLTASMPPIDLDVVGLGSAFVTVYNPGMALIADFEAFLGEMLYENTATPPTPGIRYVNVQYFANGDTSNTATAILEILNVQEPEVDLGADQTLCEGEVVLLIPTVSSDVEEYEWQDGSTAANFVVTAPGTYVLSVTNFCNAVSSDTVEIAYTEFIDPPVLGGDTVLCPGETLVLDAFVAGGDSYLWQDGSDAPTYVVSSAGQYTVEVTGACNTVTERINVDFEEEPEWPQIVADTVICPGDSVVLDLTTAGVSAYNWADGSSTPTYVIDAPGSYSVLMEWACGAYPASIQVRWAEGEGVLELGPDTLLCPEEMLELNAFVPGYIEYTWQDGATDLIYEVALPGRYEVLVSDGCVTLSDSITVGWQSCCAVYVPNAFSPNDDGVNDDFRPYFECVLSQYELLVFDRWGALVYRGTDPEDGWDGRHNGERMGTGVYTWLMTYRELGQESQLEAGDLLLMR